MDKPNEVSYYVGIGASAGGLEALESFFGAMPSESGMAFIVIQHLSPDYKSLMVELLSKRTAMQVERAEDGMVIQPNHVYLIPPKKNLTIFHGKLILTDSDHSKGINLPIDIFFRSLAEDQAEKAIAIILSGTGSDGARGIRSVKEAGGLIMVQSEESAKFDGMPRAAIATGLADFVLSTEDLVSRLVSLINRPYKTIAELPQVLLSEDDSLTKIFSLLRERLKVDFTFYKPSTIIRRIERRMAINQIQDYPNYINYLSSSSNETSILYRELLIGVTSFFRDREVFDELSERWLPEIFENVKKSEVRIWVAGCSTGEEAYTYAMLCNEYLEQNGKVSEVKIFATDLDKDALLHASNGLYQDSISADIPAKYLVKYFHKRDEGYQIDRHIREMVVFAQHNIIKDPPFTNIDLVSCRNLLIYFQPVLQKKALDFFNFSLLQSGILVLGTSETTGEMVDFYDTLHHKYKIYRSKGKRFPRQSDADFTAGQTYKQFSVLNKYQPGSVTIRVQEEDRLLERIMNTLSGEYVPLCLVVNDQHEVLHIIGDPRQYFALPVGKLVADIAKLAVKEIAIPISTGLQKVFKNGDDIVYSSIKVSVGDNIKQLNIRIKLIPGKKGAVALAAVLIEEAVPKDKSSDTTGNIYDLSIEAEEHIKDLEQELQFTRENLQATIEELETSNEELQATNEELLASNEELQSTNEELQSVNEELHTVNAEYQSKIIELTELNNDLDNLISSTRIGTLFLDENLEIRKYTPEITKVFKIISTDIGRPVYHLTHSLESVDLFPMIIEVEKSHSGKELEVITREGTWYLLTILPYQIASQVYAGVVITLVDISNLHKTQEALSVSEDRLLSIYRAAPIGLCMLKNHILLAVNLNLCRMLQTDEKDLSGAELSQLFTTPEDYTQAIGIIEEQINLNKVATIETVFKKKSGQTFPVILNIAPLNTEVSGDEMTMTVHDISLRKQAMDSARHFENRYQQLFDTMAEGVIYQNAEGKIISANGSALRILGVTFDQLIGKGSIASRWKTIHQDGTDFPVDEHPSMIALRTGEPVYGEIMGVYNPQINDVKWLQINAIPLKTTPVDPIQYVYTTFGDITVAIHAKQKAKRAEERLHTALRIAQLAWWDWHLPSGRVDASSLKAEFIGYTKEEAGEDVDFWIGRLHQDDFEATMQAMKDYLAGKSVAYSVSYRLLHKSGDYVLLHDEGRIIERDTDGKPVRLIGTVRKLVEI